MEEKNEKMELIDFDDKFTQVLNDWVEKNQTKFANADEMEAAMPDVYLRFLNTPADWLGGKAPGNAFDDVSDAGELVAMMKRYIEEEIPVPDPLLDRIAEIADDKPLMELVKDKSAPCEARMMGIELRPRPW